MEATGCVRPATWRSSHRRDALPNSDSGADGRVFAAHTTACTGQAVAADLRAVQKYCASLNVIAGSGGLAGRPGRGCLGGWSCVGAGRRREDQAELASASGSAFDLDTGTDGLCCSACDGQA